MMTLIFNWNAEVTLALTGRRPGRPAADDDFEKYKTDSKLLDLT